MDHLSGRGFGVLEGMKRSACLLIMFFCIASVEAGEKETGLIDDFERNLRPEWEPKSFKGETVYRVVPNGTGHCLKAESRDAASALIFRKEYDLKEYPVLSWRWKAGNILKKGDETKKEGDDYAARVYVIFPHWYFPKTRTINYIWANKLPKGESVPNPFTGNAIMVAVESGKEKLGEWVSERRNVYEDYRRLFGGEPPKVGAIAVMTDTDNTGGTATACYDDIRIER